MLAQRGQDTQAHTVTVTRSLFFPHPIILPCLCMLTYASVCACLLVRVRLHAYVCVCVCMLTFAQTCMYACLLMIL